MTRIIFLIVLILLFCGPCPFSPCQAASAGEPNYKDFNVILISIDTLRYDHLGCYGYHRNTSPNIDQLAKRSVVFENFIAQAYFTNISQMSIFTSQYPRESGMVGFKFGKNEFISKQLPEILKYYDYFNAAFLSSPEFYISQMMMAGKPKAPGITRNNIFSESFDVFEPTKIPRQVPEEALEWVEQNKDRKFFLWLPIGTVHWPYAWRVPESLRTMFDPKDYSPFFLNYKGYGKVNKDLLSLPMLSRIYMGNFYLNFSPIYRLTERDKAFIIARYDTGIYYTDLFVGKLLSVLEKNNLMDKTLIIIHSIHGEDLGEHGYFQHYDIYDTEVKNALIIKFPNNLFKGKRISNQVQGIDIVPTLLDYLGIPLHHEFQGQSLFPLIRGTKCRDTSRFAYITRIPLWENALGLSLLERLYYRNTDFIFTKLGRYLLGKFYYRNKNTDYIFTEIEKRKDYRGLLKQYCGVYTDRRYPPYDIAIRTNKWKLILRKNKSLLEEISWWGFISNKKISQEEVELYDLEGDPFEQHNVARLYPAVVATLKENLLRWDSDIERRRTKKISTASERSIIPYP